MNNGLQRVEHLLRKVKFNNDGKVTIGWLDIYLDPDRPVGKQHIKNYDEVTSDAKPHDDLKAAMAPFSDHFAIRCDQAKQVKGNYAFDGTAKGADKCAITTVTFSGAEPDPDNDEDGGPLAAHITCYTKWEGGGGATWCSPGMKPNAPNEKYKFTAELDAHIGILEREAWAYLDGKIAPAPVDPQQAMKFDADGNPIGDDGAADHSIEAIGAGTREEAMAAANSTPLSDDDE